MSDRQHETALTLLRGTFERFGKLPDEVWRGVSEPWSIRSVRRGQILTHPGEVEQTFAIIVEGAQRLFFTTDEGDEHTVAFMYPPGYTGVPDSFFLQQASTTSIEALTDGRILATDYRSFSALMDKHRELETWAWQLFLTALSGRFKRERDMLTMTANDRYERLLRESPQILQIAPLRHVASYLGMTPETLSRVRAGGS